MLYQYHSLQTYYKSVSNGTAISSFCKYRIYFRHTGYVRSHFSQKRHEKALHDTETQAKRHSKRDEKRERVKRATESTDTKQKSLPRVLMEQGRDNVTKKAATYSPAGLRSTIGAPGLNFSVRDGKRWNPGAIATQVFLYWKDCRTEGPATDDHDQLYLTTGRKREQVTRRRTT